MTPELYTTCFLVSSVILMILLAITAVLNGIKRIRLTRWRLIETLLVIFFVLLTVYIVFFGAYIFVR